MQRAWLATIGGADGCKAWLPAVDSWQLAAGVVTAVSAMLMLLFYLFGLGLGQKGKGETALDIDFFFI